MEIWREGGREREREIYRELGRGKEMDGKKEKDRKMKGKDT